MNETRVTLEGVVLKKIYDPHREFMTLAGITNRTVDRNERVGVIKTMINCGYDENETIVIISSYGAWDMAKSIQQIHNIYMEEQRISNKAVGISHNPNVFFGSNRIPSFNIQNTDDLMKAFWGVVNPIHKLSISPKLSIAPWEYRELGYHPLPKAPKECKCRLCRDRPPEGRGKHPSLKSWKEYQYRQPTSKEMDAWDWNNGVCLPATQHHSFSDLDQKYGGQIISHAERTPRGGLHMFGDGGCKTINIQGVGEIKGMGSLIVAYPTPGYALI